MARPLRARLAEEKDVEDVELADRCPWSRPVRSTTRVSLRPLPARLQVYRSHADRSKGHQARAGTGPPTADVDRRLTACHSSGEGSSSSTLSSSSASS